MSRRRSPELAPGVRVLVTRGHWKGERGVVTNSPMRVFTGWTVRLDNGRYFGSNAADLKVEVEGS